MLLLIDGLNRVVDGLYFFVFFLFASLRIHRDSALKLPQKLEALQRINL